jgi:hypothetical protein
LWIQPGNVDVLRGSNEKYGVKFSRLSGEWIQNPETYIYTWMIIFWTRCRDKLLIDKFKTN